MLLADAVINGPATDDREVQVPISGLRRGMNEAWVRPMTPSRSSGKSSLLHWAGGAPRMPLGSECGGYDADIAFDVPSVSEVCLPLRLERR